MASPHLRTAWGSGAAGLTVGCARASAPFSKQPGDLPGALETLPPEAATRRALEPGRDELARPSWIGSALQQQGDGVDVVLDEGVARDGVREGGAAAVAVLGLEGGSVVQEQGDDLRAAGLR